MSLFRPLYDWTLRQAEKPYSAWMLFAIAFAEASFFPLPPDILLLPLVIAKRDKAYRLAVICTVGSVIGGLLGYAIGHLAMEAVGYKIVHAYHGEDALQHFRDLFAKYGGWIIIAKGLTPIPFKLVTIASGIAGMNLGIFVLSCTITRAVRFFLLAALVRRYGPGIQSFIEKYLTWVMLAVLAGVALGFWLILGN